MTTKRRIFFLSLLAARGMMPRRRSAEPTKRILRQRSAADAPKRDPQVQALRARLALSPSRSQSNSKSRLALRACSRLLPPGRGRLAAAGAGPAWDELRSDGRDRLRFCSA